jgi:hypothetical protein
VDYRSLFDIEADGKLSGIYTASRYLVERIYLNRPQLILERRRYALSEQHRKLNEDTTVLAEKLKDKDDTESRGLLSAMLSLGLDLQNLMIKIQSIPPYEVSDVTRV